MKVPRDFTDSKHLIENEFKDNGYKDSAEYRDNTEYRDSNLERTPPPTETDFWVAATYILQFRASSAILVKLINVFWLVGQSL